MKQCDRLICGSNNCKGSVYSSVYVSIGELSCHGGRGEGGRKHRKLDGAVPRSDKIITGRSWSEQCQELTLQASVKCQISTSEKSHIFPTCWVLPTDYSMNSFPMWSSAEGRYLAQNNSFSSGAAHIRQLVLSFTMQNPNFLSQCDISPKGILVQNFPMGSV